MRRYFSHYTILEPGNFLSCHIVELDDDGMFVQAYPFVEELRNTEYFSGLLVFQSENSKLDMKWIEKTWIFGKIESFRSKFGDIPVQQNDIQKKTKLSPIHLP